MILERLMPSSEGRLRKEKMATVDTNFTTWLSYALESLIEISSTDQPSVNNSSCASQAGNTSKSLLSLWAIAHTKRSKYLDAQAISIKLSSAQCNCNASPPSAVHTPTTSLHNHASSRIDWTSHNLRLPHCTLFSIAPVRLTPPRSH